MPVAFQNQLSSTLIPSTMAHAQSRSISCNDQTEIYNRLTHLKAASNTSSYTSSQNICSLVLSQLCEPLFGDVCTASNKVGLGHHHLVVDHRPSHLETWCYGLLAVTVICCCAAFGFCFQPLMKRDVFESILMWMVGLAVGCLSGIAIFHLIPQAFELPHDTPQQLEAYLHKSLAILAAIYFFYIAERIFRMSVEHRKHIKSKIEIPRLSTDYTGTEQSAALENGYVLAGEIDSEKQAEGQRNGHVHSEHMDNSKGHHHFHMSEACEEDRPIRTVAWMILTGDGLHKLVDGLSIGAAFSLSVLEGLSISLALICEDLPHVLGDLAVLINSGLKLKRAILYNFLSGLPSYLGFVAGVFLGELPTATSWIFAVAGGMFLYIAFVNILPEMSAAMESAGQLGVKHALHVFLIQSCGLLFGLILMYVLARYSEQITIH